MGALSNRKTFNSILFLSTSTRGRTKLWIHVLLFLFCYLVFCLFVIFMVDSFNCWYLIRIDIEICVLIFFCSFLRLILTSLLFTSSLLHSCVCFICFPCFSFYFAWQQTSCFVFLLVSFSLGGVRFFFNFVYFFATGGGGGGDDGELVVVLLLLRSLSENITCQVGGRWGSDVKTVCH